MTAFSHRPAVVADAVHLAALVDMASQGMATRLWLTMTAPGQGPFEIGRARAMREDAGLSYRNATMAEIGGAVAGTLVGYALRREDDGAGLPEMLKPLIALENLVVGTWYVNVLAVYPEFRGRGIGGDLLEIADQRAAADPDAPRGLSIIVASTNVGARRLYDRHGFRFLAKRPVVPFPGGPGPGDWLLLTKPHG